MRFVSTRGAAPAVSLSEAIRNGAAPDGGLYLPETLPSVDVGRLDPEMDLAPFAAVMLAPFFAGDALEGDLPAICAEAFDFPVQLVTPYPAKPHLRALELFQSLGIAKDADEVQEALRTLPAT